MLLFGLLAGGRLFVAPDLVTRTSVKLLLPTSRPPLAFDGDFGARSLVFCEALGDWERRPFSSNGASAPNTRRLPPVIS